MYLLHCDTLHVSDDVVCLVERLRCLCFCWCLSDAGRIRSWAYFLFLLRIVIVDRCRRREGTQYSNFGRWVYSTQDVCSIDSYSQWQKHIRRKNKPNLPTKRLRSVKRSPFGSASCRYLHTLTLRVLSPSEAQTSWAFCVVDHIPEPTWNWSVPSSVLPTLLLPLPVLPMINTWYFRDTISMPSSSQRALAWAAIRSDKASTETHGLSK